MVGVNRMNGKVIAIVALACAACVAADCWPHFCKGITVDNVPGCHLTGEGCKCEQLIRHRYKVTLKDPTTGASGWSGWEGDSNQAGKMAVYELFTVDKGCNCHNQQFPLGKCQILGQFCFWFRDVGAIDHNDPSFHLKAWRAVNNQWVEAASGEAGKSADMQNVLLAMYGQLVAKYPDCKAGAGAMLAAMTPDNRTQYYIPDSN